MTFEEAARIQYRRNSMYVVFLVGPAGEKERVGRTSRKSGSGLLKLLQADSVQARIRQFPNAETLRITKKTATTLAFSNGWKLEFGGTIREEATR